MPAGSGKGERATRIRLHRLAVLAVVAQRRTLPHCGDCRAAVDAPLHDKVLHPKDSTAVKKVAGDESVEACGPNGRPLGMHLHQNRLRWLTLGGDNQLHRNIVGLYPVCSAWRRLQEPPNRTDDRRDDEEEAAAGNHQRGSVFAIIVVFGPLDAGATQVCYNSFDLYYANQTDVTRPPRRPPR